MNINQYIGIGRLTKDPELKYTNTNVAVCKFNLAVDDGFGDNKSTSFIPMVAWRKTAEMIAKYLEKGSLIAVDGRISTRDYTNKDNTKVFVVEVIVNNIQFLSKSSKVVEKEAIQKVTPEEIEKESDPFQDFGDSISIDDNFLD